MGRETGQIHLRVVDDTKGLTLSQHVHRFIHQGALVNTDEYQIYNGVQRLRETVCHGAQKYARDEDGDGFCQVHCNSVEGMWTDVRNFLRPFKGVHKRYLSGYIAICEFRRNLKHISSDFISQLVRFHTFYT